MLLKKYLKRESLTYCKKIMAHILQERKRKRHLTWFETYNTLNSQVVQRFNRTLKDKLYEYFTANKTNR